MIKRSNLIVHLNSMTFNYVDKLCDKRVLYNIINNLVRVEINPIFAIKQKTIFFTLEIVPIGNH